MKLFILVLGISLSSFAQDMNTYNYNQAVKKAYHFKKLNRPRVLFNISDSNSKLEFACNPRWGCKGRSKDWERGGLFKDNVRVKMVSWVSQGTANRFFTPLVGGPKPYNTGKRFLWVSAFPQVQNFCKNVSTSNVKLRLEQYMGMPPSSGKSHFVHVWVRPKDLFRPCYDPAVHDTKCDYDFSSDADPKHQKWMSTQFTSAYPKSGTRYPWTRLGYTYDWGNPKGYIGATEYVIKESSDIYIESVTPTGIYCAK